MYTYLYKKMEVTITDGFVNIIAELSRTSVALPYSCSTPTSVALHPVNFRTYPPFLLSCTGSMLVY
jgi:hypothetical protein